MVPHVLHPLLIDCQQRSSATSSSCSGYRKGPILSSTSKPGHGISLFTPPVYTSPTSLADGIQLPSIPLSSGLASMIVSFLACTLSFNAPAHVQYLSVPALQSLSDTHLCVCPIISPSLATVISNVSISDSKRMTFSPNTACPSLLLYSRFSPFSV